MEQRTILLLGAEATHGAALAYARALLEARGHAVLALETEGEEGGGARPGPASPSGSGSLPGGGLPARVLALHRVGRCHGVLGVGAAATTAAATAAMRALPVGVPKLMLSTVASGPAGDRVGVRDLTLTHAPADLRTLNAVTRRLVANAAGAVAGMVEQATPPAAARPLVAATMFGVTTPCVDRVRALLDAAGYEVVVFHANGRGGRAMEGLVGDGFFVGVADVTTTEWADEVVGGLRSAGPDRLGAAGRAGIPQVVSVGALDMVNFAAPHTVPPRWRGRLLHRHNPNATLMRTTPAEGAEIGRRIAGRLNAARGPTVLLLPLRGVSTLDAEGQPFHDPTADRALFDALRAHLRPPVRVVELDAHINDPAFADALADAFLAVMDGR